MKNDCSQTGRTSPSLTGRKQVYKLLASCWDSTQGQLDWMWGHLPPSTALTRPGTIHLCPQPSCTHVFTTAGLRQGCSQQTSNHHPPARGPLATTASGVLGVPGVRHQGSWRLVQTRGTRIHWNQTLPNLQRSGGGEGHSKDPPREAGGCRLHHPHS